MCKQYLCFMATDYLYKAAACAEIAKTVGRLQYGWVRITITVIKCFRNSGNGVHVLQTVIGVSKTFNHSKDYSHPNTLQSANST